MSINALIELVGKPYQAMDEEGNYIGCFEPIYFLYSNTPRFKLPENKQEYFDFALSQIKNHFKKVDIKNIQKGNIVIFNLPKGILHVGVYLGENRIIQTFKNSTMTINKISFDNERIVGVFRKEV